MIKRSLRSVKNMSISIKNYRKHCVRSTRTDAVLIKKQHPYKKRSQDQVCNLKHEPAQSYGTQELPLSWYGMTVSGLSEKRCFQMVRYMQSGLISLSSEIVCKEYLRMLGHSMTEQFTKYIHPEGFKTNHSTMQNELYDFVKDLIYGKNNWLKISYL